MALRVSSLHIPGEVQIEDIIYTAGLTLIDAYVVLDRFTFRKSAPEAERGKWAARVYTGHGGNFVAHVGYVIGPCDTSSDAPEATAQGYALAKLDPRFADAEDC